eukprot:2474198-Rhodomonas_salina.2
MSFTDQKIQDRSATPPADTCTVLAMSVADSVRQEVICQADNFPHRSQAAQNNQHLRLAAPDYSRNQLPRRSMDGTCKGGSDLRRRTTEEWSAIFRRSSH